MSHLSEEDLVLHHFGEAEDPAATRRTSRSARRAGPPQAGCGATSAAVPLPEPPERGEDYGAQVWARLQPRLGRAQSSRLAASGRRWALAASLVLAFLLGRHWPHETPAPAAVSAAARERILLVAVGDHLERSEMLLVELVNAGADGRPVDISPQQQ